MASGALLPVPMAAAESVLERRPRHVIDLRSPAEFAEDHLSGAVNVPLFDDLERALIGSLYSRCSPEAAFEEGLARTRERIVAFTREIAAHCGWRLPEVDLEQRVERLAAPGLARLERELAPAPVAPAPGSVVLYCWRGGLRSRAVVAFLRDLGREDVLGIEGGYRAYRRCVRTRIEGWQAPPSFVLRGLTGVGKTLVLRALSELRPDQVLDLEEMAGHRSSILGMVGLEPASQKLFESRLAERFARGFGATSEPVRESPAACELSRTRRGSSLLGDPQDRLAAPSAHQESMVAAPPSIPPPIRVVAAPSHDASGWLSAGAGFSHGLCVVEGESRKVGDLVLPAPVWRAIDGGVALELTTDRARRVRVLLEDYLASERSRAELARRLPFIEARLGPRWSGGLVALLDAGREAELVELLLERYYDPLYRHSERGRRYAARFDSTDPRTAAAEITRWIERQRVPARSEHGSGFLRAPSPAAPTPADL